MAKLEGAISIPRRLLCLITPQYHITLRSDIQSCVRVSCEGTILDCSLTIIIHTNTALLAVAYLAIANE